MCGDRIVCVLDQERDRSKGCMRKVGRRYKTLLCDQNTAAKLANRSGSVEVSLLELGPRMGNGKRG